MAKKRRYAQKARYATEKVAPAGPRVERQPSDPAHAGDGRPASCLQTMLGRGAVESVSLMLDETSGGMRVTYQLPTDYQRFGHVQGHTPPWLRAHFRL